MTHSEIRERRKVLGLRQFEAGDAVGLSETRYSQIERGARLFTPAEAQALARLLDCDPEEIPTEDAGRGKYTTARTGVRDRNGVVIAAGWLPGVPFSSVYPRGSAEWAERLDELGRKLRAGIPRHEREDDEE